MAAKLRLRVIQDPKCTGTVTREQVDRVIRQIETDRSSQQGHAGESPARSVSNGGPPKR
jgi:hypothetical protein